MLVYKQGSSKLNVGLHTRVIKVQCTFTYKGLQTLMLVYIQGSSNFDVGLQYIQGSLKFNVGLHTRIFKVQSWIAKLESNIYDKRDAFDIVNRFFLMKIISSLLPLLMVKYFAAH